MKRQRGRNRNNNRNNNNNHNRSLDSNGPDVKSWSWACRTGWACRWRRRKW